MTATPAWLAAIEALINRGIAGSARASELAGRLNATALRIDIQGVTAIRAAVSGGRIALVAETSPANVAAAGDAASDDHSSGAAVDATIVGSPLALLQLARGEADRGAAVAAQVRGDAELANSYRQLFTCARPDLEEEISRIVGDFPARRLTQLASHTLAWVRRAGRTTRDNVAEYLQEESRDLVGKLELEEFLHSVDTLRETADRVEARLARLEQRLKGSP